MGDKIARLVGAATGEVIVADSTSVDLFKLIAATLVSKPDRKTLLAVQGEFPTDLYMAHGAVDLAGGGRRMRMVERDGIEAALDDDVALLVLTHGHYKTAELFDMKAISLNRSTDVESATITSPAAAPTSRAILSPTRVGAPIQSRVVQPWTREAPHSSCTAAATRAGVALGKAPRELPAR